LQKSNIEFLIIDNDIKNNKNYTLSIIYNILQLYNVKIILINSTNDKELIKNAFSIGITYFMLKNNYTEFPKILLQIHNKELPYFPILEDYKKLKRNEQLSLLSPAEKELFNLIEQGFSQSEIINILFKSENTIKSQKKKILRKLNVTCCKEAVKKIHSNGVIIM
ncbi:MAG: LuxR C-terminal-related transcriptional regulator, partial [Clostridiales bacterium]